MQTITRLNKRTSPLCTLSVISDDALMFVSQVVFCGFMCVFWFVGSYAHLLIITHANIKHKTENTKDRVGIAEIN